MKIERHEAARRTLDAPPAPPVPPATEPDPAVSYYASCTRSLPEDLSAKSDEIQRLRMRQETLEKQKQALDVLRRKLDAFAGGRRDLLEKLGRSIVLLSREETRAARMATLCAESRKHFEHLRHELEAQVPDEWSEADFDAALTQALAQVESARQVYRRTLDRVNASDWSLSDDRRPALKGRAVDDDPVRSPAGFGYWFKAGLAFTLPPTILVGGLIALLAWRLGWWV